MAQTLIQGANVSLSALAGGTNRVAVEVAWSPERIGGLEVDASAFLVTAAGKVRSDADFVFYNQRRSPEGSVETGAAAGGGRQRFEVELSRVPL